MIDLKIENSELDVCSAIKAVNTPQCGAISIFIGITRENFNGNKIKTLFYEAYESMALNEMESITILVRQKWPEVVNIAIHHRIGEVKVGEPGVVIAASSPHRKHAQEAVSFILDRLKTTVPIFKKELFEDGSGEWKANVECSWKNNNKLNC
ncbi:Molybdopterin synthase catalytic subunit, eukaryotes,Molybdopterin biosynthesis MoaE [Cinara cedri]|uniref:Molybdopterin synthase catalytic subunit n=1 Tax=Cinara cedri TaxID=506608 RepID=A0A5E4N1A0_9HEMI|nr:Molybdopterin synthase catalytic subunit, eukaryotes,Molybdopterin biosynthesis MoaE [Cinara cedri]